MDKDLTGWEEDFHQLERRGEENKNFSFVHNLRLVEFGIMENPAGEFNLQGNESEMIEQKEVSKRKEKEGKLKVNSSNPPPKSHIVPRYLGCRYSPRSKKDPQSSRR